MGISLNPAALLSGQGLDVNTVVSQILNQKSGQLTQWQNQQTVLQLQAGLINAINNDVKALATAVTALSDPLSAITTPAATSSDTKILSAAADSSAAQSIHTVIVTSTATPGIVYTNGFAAGADASILSSGAVSANLQIQIGGQNGTTADIQIAAGANDTLNTLASSINQQSLTNQWGITAAVVTDASGARLTLTSDATGNPGALSIANNTTALSFNIPLGGSNAEFSIDGIPYSSATNSVTGAIAGVTLSLVAAAPGTAVKLTVGPDVQNITQAINNFVNAYNQVIKDINQQYAVDPATDSQGPLAGDSALRNLQSSLLNDVTYSVSGNSGLVNLAALGINMNNDGTLTVGTNPSGQNLEQILTANPKAFQNFFQNEASTGFANLFHNDLINITDSTLGLLNVDLAQNKIGQQNLADNIHNFERQLTAQQQQLTQAFSKINASLQSYPLLLQQVTDTLATLDSASGGSSHR